MKHLFISYKKSDDGDFADAVANRIEKAGFSTWIDNDKLQGAIKALTAIPGLIAATQDPNEDIQTVAKRALKRIKAS